MSECCQKALTAQEKWIQLNQYQTEGRERTLKINEIVRSKPIKMDINRARLFTESFRATEGENLLIRWAKAFLHVTENIPVYVEPDYELIVGKMTGDIGRFGTLYPENDGPALLQLKNAANRPISPYLVTEEDYKIIEEEIYPYWKDSSYA